MSAAKGADTCTFAYAVGLQTQDGQQHKLSTSLAGGWLAGPAGIFDNHSSFNDVRPMHTCLRALISIHRVRAVVPSPIYAKAGHGRPRATVKTSPVASSTGDQNWSMAQIIALELVIALPAIHLHLSAGTVSTVVNVFDKALIACHNLSSASNGHLTARFQVCLTCIFALQGRL